MNWRAILVDGPARLVDLAWLGYRILVVALTLVCLLTAALWLALWSAGYRLP